MPITVSNYCMIIKAHSKYLIKHPIKVDFNYKFVIIILTSIHSSSF